MVKNVMLIFGTRPEAIKLSPLINELKGRSQLRTLVCVTGQHVEAGLHTHDIWSSYPEEFNRQAVRILAGFHFAPTAEAAANLAQEGKLSEHFFVTG